MSYFEIRDQNLARLGDDVLVVVAAGSGAPESFVGDNDDEDDDTPSLRTCATYTYIHIHTHTGARARLPRARTRFVIFISRVTPRTWKARPAVSAAPRAPPISSFKIILRPEGHSALSYPPRQITLAQHLTPTAVGRTERGAERERHEVMERHGRACAG